MPPAFPTSVCFGTPEGCLTLNSYLIVPHKPHLIPQAHPCLVYLTRDIWEPAWSSSAMGTRCGCWEGHTGSPGTALWGCDLSRPPQPSHMDNTGHAGHRGQGGSSASPSSRGSRGGSAPPGRYLSVPGPPGGTRQPGASWDPLAQGSRGGLRALRAAEHPGVCWTPPAQGRCEGPSTPRPARTPQSRAPKRN